MRYASFAIVMMAAVAAGQTPPTEFEIASVKVVPEGARTSVRFTILPDGHLRIASQTLNNVIRQTFGGTADIVGVPDWARTLILDIDAKTPAGSAAAPTVVFPMIRRLLETRFAMRWHVEEREMPVFDLFVDKPGQLGRGLATSDLECDSDPATLVDSELPCRLS